MDGRYPRPAPPFVLRTVFTYLTLFVVRLSLLTAQDHTLHIIQEPSSLLNAGEEFEIRVEVRDQNGVPDADFNPSIDLSLLGGVLQGDTSEKVDNNGVARFDNLSIGLGGSFRIVATGGPARPDTSSTLVVQSALTAVQLEFDQQPTTTSAGATISPAVTVRAVDILGLTDITFTDDVTITIGNNPGGGTLSGTTTVAAVNGVATFSNLSIDKIGSGYTLTATSTVNPANSETFSITPGPASGATSQITASPTSIPADGSSESTITVELRDAEDNPLTDGGDNVVLSTTAGSLSSVTDLGNGTYQATLTASSTAETATVTGTVNGSAITDDATVTFTAVGPGPPSGATSQITASPTTIPANGTSTSTITVQLRDAAGTPLTTGGATVVLSTTAGSLGSVTDLGNGSYQATLTSSSSPTNVTATISGTVNGDAISDDATVTFTGVGPGPPSGATSQITASPTSIPANGSSTSTITVALRDAAGTPLTTGGATVTLSTTAGTLGSVSDNGDGTYEATLTSSTSSTNVTATVSGTVNGSNITDTASVTFTGVGPGPPSGATSQITAAPTSIPANGSSTSTITVQLRDAAGTPLNSGGANVTLSTTAGSLSSVFDNGNGTYNATLTSTSSTTNVVATISGTVNGNAITDTATVTFTGVAPVATRLEFGQQPTNEQAGAAISPAVTVRAVNNGGVTVTSFTANITIAIGSNPGGGTLSGTTTVAAVNGVATFSNLSINRTGNGYTLTASSGSLTGATSNSFSITPGPPSGATSQITASPTSIPANGASTSTITVELRDALGNPLTVGGAAVVLSTTAGSLGPVSDQGNGRYTAILTSSSSTTNVNAIVSGTVNGAAITDTATVTFTAVAPVATRLVFGQQPTQTQAGAAIAPPVTVRAVSNAGATVTSFTGNVTIAIGNNPGAGTLSGTTTVAAVNGVATFNNLSINRTGNGYTLTASASGLAGATSSPFAITPAAPSRTTSLITASPTSVPADGASTSAITVEMFDAFGNRVTSGGASVTLSTTTGTLGPVTDLGNGTYTATLTAPSAPGTATISGSIGGSGGGSIVDTATVTFTMVPPNTLRLAFVQQPSNTQAGLTISPPVTVRVVDLGGATVTSFNQEVTIAISVNPTGGTLAGTTTVVAVNGVATFNSLSIARAGAGYRLAVGASAITGATSDPFTITPGPPFGPTTQITAAPTSIPANGTSTSTITVEVRDAQGNRRVTGGDVVTLSTTIGTLSAVTDLGNGTYSATLTSSTTGGTATISGTVASSTIVDTATVEFTSSGPAPATGLAFGQQPSNVQVGAAISPPVTVRAVDGTGATATSFTGSITIALGLNPTGAVLSGTTTATAVAGVATFANLSVDRAGGYTLVANATGLTSATSSAFTVTASPPPTTADLAVTASVDDGTPAVGDTVVYTIRVTNQGPAQATGVQVSYDLGDRMAFVSSVPTQGSYNPQSEIWTVGTLEPGAGATLEISAQVQR